MKLEDSEVYDCIKTEVQKVIDNTIKPNLFKFDFDGAIRSDIMLVPVKADNPFGMSAIQVWKLIETYQVDIDGSIKLDIK
jgi:hypothetical protein